MTDVYKQNVEGIITITDGGKYYIKDITHRLSSFNEVGTVQGTVLPAPGASEPIEGNSALLEINGTAVFDGIVRTFRRKEDGAYQLTLASDMQQYKNKKKNVAISPGKSIKKLVENVTNDLMTDVTIVEPVENLDLKYRFMRKDTPVADILDDLAKMSDSYWWLEPTNLFYFGNPADYSKTFIAEFPTKMSAGKETPAYKSVSVLGSAIEDNRGPEYNHMVSKDYVISHWTVKEGENGKYKVEQTGANPPGPVYTYRDKEIKKQKHADVVGKRVCKQLAQQQQGGTLSICGEEELRPMDVIQMREEFGGESYLVSAVEHELSSKDGFISRIQCGGIVDR